MTLRRNFSWTFIGNVVYAACQWGMLSVLAKLGDPVMVGQFALAVAVTTPVLAFANLQLRGVQATDAKREFVFGDYLALRCLTTILALGAIAGLVLLSNYSNTVSAAILVMAVGRGLDALSDVFYGRFQQQEQMDIIAKAMIVNGVLSVSALAAGVYGTGRLVIGVAGAALASAFTLAIVAFLLSRREAEVNSCSSDALAHADLKTISPRWSRTTLLRLLTLTLPMGVVMFLVTLNGNIPRYALEAFGDERQLGIYSALAYLLVAGSTVVSALGQSASPRLAKMYASGDTRGFRLLLRKLVLFALALGTVGAMLSLVAGRWLLSLLYTPEYAPYVHVLIILAISASFSFAASFMGYGMTAARKFRSQVPLFVIVVGVSLAGSVLLIPRYGLTGAAWTVVVAALANLLGSNQIIRSALAEKESQYVS